MLEIWGSWVPKRASARLTGGCAPGLGWTLSCSGGRSRRGCCNGARGGGRWSGRRVALPFDAIVRSSGELSAVLDARVVRPELVDSNVPGRCHSLAGVGSVRSV